MLLEEAGNIGAQELAGCRFDGRVPVAQQYKDGTEGAQLSNGGYVAERAGKHDDERYADHHLQHGTHTCGVNEAAAHRKIGRRHHVLAGNLQPQQKGREANQTYRFGTHCSPLRCFELCSRPGNSTTFAW